MGVPMSAMSTGPHQPLTVNLNVRKMISVSSLDIVQSQDNATSKLQRATIVIPLLFQDQNFAQPRKVRILNDNMYSSRF